MAPFCSGIDKRTPEAGIARATAGASFELHGHLDWNYQQLFPDTADTANLERRAGFYGISRRAGALAVGSMLIEGVDGTVIPASTALGSETGLEFRTSAAGVIAAGVALVSVTAVLPGATGNIPAGSRLALFSPIVGLDSEGVVEAPGLSAGADTETDAQLLDRLLFRMRRPGHGGASSDYVRWALEVPGITQAWVAGGEMGLGTVTLRIAVDDAPMARSRHLPRSRPSMRISMGEHPRATSSKAAP